MVSLKGKKQLWWYDFGSGTGQEGGGGDEGLNREERADLHNAVQKKAARFNPSLDGQGEVTDDTSGCKK